MAKAKKAYSIVTVAASFAGIDKAIDKAQDQLNWSMAQAKDHFNTDPIMAAYQATVTKVMRTKLRNYVEALCPIEFVIEKGQVSFVWTSDKTDVANWFVKLPDENFVQFGTPSDEALIELKVLEMLDKQIDTWTKVNKKTGKSKYDVQDPEVLRSLRNFVDVQKTMAATGDRASPEAVEKLERRGEVVA